LAVLHQLANATATNPSRPSLIQLLTGVLVAQEQAVGLPREALQSFRQVEGFRTGDSFSLGL
jgi:hypothetical protein